MAGIRIDHAGTGVFGIRSQFLITSAQIRGQSAKLIRFVRGFDNNVLRCSCNFFCGGHHFALVHAETVRITLISPSTSGTVVIKGKNNLCDVFGQTTYHANVGHKFGNGTNQLFN